MPASSAVKRLRAWTFQSSVAVGAAVVLFAACATTPETPSGTERQVHAAQATLQSFLEDPQMAWIKENLPRARAVLISSSLTRGGLGIGAAGGEAVALAHDPKTGKWVGPAFYNMSAGSVGFQAGLDVSEMVVLVMSEKGLDALLDSSVKFGGNASVAAGPISAGQTQNVDRDFVTFARSKGAYAGLSLQGGVISPDEGANNAFYGKPASPVDILIRASVHNPAAAPLQQALVQRSAATGR